MTEREKPWIPQEDPQDVERDFYGVVPAIVNKWEFSGGPYTYGRRVLSIRIKDNPGVLAARSFARGWKLLNACKNRGSVWPGEELKELQKSGILHPANSSKGS